jgi:hypothetical protein
MQLKDTDTSCAGTTNANNLTRCELQLKETHRHYHHPHTRLPPEDSFDSDSSGSDGGQDDANDAMSAATGNGGRPITAATGTTASSR